MPESGVTIRCPGPSPTNCPGPSAIAGARAVSSASCQDRAWPGTISRAREALLTAEEIVARADAGEARADGCMARFSHRLARGLAQVINILDPDVIVLGGGLSRIPRLYDSVPRLWGEFVFSDHVDTPLRPPVHGDSSGVRGAAWLW